MMNNEIRHVKENQIILHVREQHLRSTQIKNKGFQIENADVTAY